MSKITQRISDMYNNVNPTMNCKKELELVGNLFKDYNIFSPCVELYKCNIFNFDWHFGHLLLAIHAVHDFQQEKNLLTVDEN